jgi:hypothetical protein
LSPKNTEYVAEKHRICGRNTRITVQKAQNMWPKDLWPNFALPVALIYERFIPCTLLILEPSHYYSFIQYGSRKKEWFRLPEGDRAKINARFVCSMLSNFTTYDSRVNVCTVPSRLRHNATKVYLSKGPLNVNCEIQPASFYNTFTYRTGPSLPETASYVTPSFPVDHNSRVQLSSVLLGSPFVKFMLTRLRSESKRFFHHH